MVDYSVWDHIEVSDDEDETHPNIDTPSLFRWRHQARVEKMQEMEKKKEDVTQSKTKLERQIDELKERMKKLEVEGKKDQLKLLQAEIDELKRQEEHFRKKEKELIDEEKAQPWNIDTLSKPGFQKTVINKVEPKQKKNVSDEEQMENWNKFLKKHKEDIKKYGMLHEYHDSEQFLLKNSHLACEETANYLVVWCVDLEVEEKHALMERVAHQTICMQFLLELARTMECDPRSTIRPFFNKMRKSDDSYMDGFQDELKSFIKRVKERAQARIEKALEEYEAEEKQKRLGPGGLDPVEVFETLPKKLQDCFESKNVQMLQDVLTSMPEDEAKYHLKRCIDSGLWVPDAKKAEQDAMKAEQDAKQGEAAGES
ncbi:hsp90 co-chaperone Cdc37-like [Rhopilema esculentum]|uniref:hsp90 co-chaperone Cdc37-like n=1 Tax=Rhopilema esculentum TaxID=499914 RepID=UPI0031CEEFE3|eukprot:gene5016-123_t